MRLKEVILKNFRSYKDARIPIDEALTGIIGKNDAGKSTILEALEIFFNNNLPKIESSDLSVVADSKAISIVCIFSDLPDELVIDETAKTSLENEFLLNEQGFLEIQKDYDCNKKAPSPEIFCNAYHPCDKDFKDLLFLKNAELKSRISSLGIESNFDSNVTMRRSIWQSQKDLKKELTKLPLNKEDGKKIWDKLQTHLPLYALFQSDRKSTDEDSEVQDPMKLAIQEAIKSVESQLETIRNEVKTKVEEVAKRTINKLTEMDESLAETLTPNFSSDPKWEGFKFSLTSGDQIPINKRGSGVRRLILLNFFRAEAERKMFLKDSPNVIYAVEEPETSQHPDNQIKIINALKKLAQDDKCQVLITTHVPGLAGLLEISGLRYVKKEGKESTVEINPDNDFISKIADDIGVLPDERVKVFLFVEGKNDVIFWNHLGKIAHNYASLYPAIGVDHRIIILPMGGSNLKDWVAKRYLKPFKKPEIYVFDRDSSQKPQYQVCANEVNSRKDGSKAFLLEKKEMENYIHPDAIKAEYGYKIQIEDFTDVPEIIAKKVHEDSGSLALWELLDDEKKKKKIGQAKSRLNDNAIAKVSWTQFNAMDTHKEFEKIFNYLNSLLKNTEKVKKKGKKSETEENKVNLFEKLF